MPLALTTSTARYLLQPVIDHIHKIHPERVAMAESYMSPKVGLARLNRLRPRRESYSDVIFRDDARLTDLLGCWRSAPRANSANASDRCKAVYDGVGGR
jgi:hypothetical protein